VAWRGSAEFISKYFGRGDMIGIEGSIQTRKYTDKNGNDRTVFEVVVSNVQFIGGKKNNAEETQEDPLDDFSNKVNEFASIDDLPF
jgi:single-strand DNA-binding protein